MGRAATRTIVYRLAGLSRRELRAGRGPWRRRVLRACTAAVTRAMARAQRARELLLDRGAESGADGLESRSVALQGAERERHGLDRREASLGRLTAEGSVPARAGRWHGDARQRRQRRVVAQHPLRLRP